MGLEINPKSQCPCQAIVLDGLKIKPQDCRDCQTEDALLHLSFLESPNPTGRVRHTVGWCCDSEMFALWLLSVPIVHFWPPEGFSV